MKKHFPRGWDGEGRRVSEESLLEGVCKELGGATVGSANSALSYTEFLPLKSDTTC